jgi:predicted GNAT family acetyltransferase
MDLKIEHAPTGDHGAWFIEHDGRRVGEMVYRTDRPGTITIVHTEVGPELRGQGAGLKLVEAAVVWAREQGKKIIAQCKFARATFEKHPELRDVLAS